MDRGSDSAVASPRYCCCLLLRDGRIGRQPHHRRARHDLGDALPHPAHADRAARMARGVQPVGMARVACGHDDLHRAVRLERGGVVVQRDAVARVIQRSPASGSRARTSSSRTRAAALRPPAPRRGQARNNRRGTGSRDRGRSPRRRASLPQSGSLLREVADQDSAISTKARIISGVAVRARPTCSGASGAGRSRRSRRSIASSDARSLARSANVWRTISEPASGGSGSQFGAARSPPRNNSKRRSAPSASSRASSACAVPRPPAPKAPAWMLKLIQRAVPSVAEHAVGVAAVDARAEVEVVRVLVDDLDRLVRAAVQLRDAGDRCTRGTTRSRSARAA